LAQIEKRTALDWCGGKQFYNQANIGLALTIDEQYARVGDRSLYHSEKLAN